MNTHVGTTSYVLISAAHNEEQYIEQPLRSVVSQTILPTRWIIVSDGSTDRTNEIIGKYAKAYDFIELVQLKKGHRRDFTAKVNALKSGWERLKHLPFEFIGILDADISFDCKYYRDLLQEFQANPKLGLTGGLIWEESAGRFVARRTNRFSSVAGATQLFRRECYERIGGIQSLKYGGEDWCAEIGARMNGWEVRVAPQLKAFHHRSTGSAGGELLRYCFRQGRMDFSLGSYPLFEVLKCVRRIPEKPRLLGAIGRIAGYLWGALRKEEDFVSPGIRSFLRNEQRARVKRQLGRLFSTKGVAQHRVS